MVQLTYPSVAIDHADGGTRTRAVGIAVCELLRHRSDHKTGGGEDGSISDRQRYAFDRAQNICEFMLHIDVRAFGPPSAS